MEDKYIWTIIYFLIFIVLISVLFILKLSFGRKYDMKRDMNDDLRSFINSKKNQKNQNSYSYEKENIYEIEDANFDINNLSEEFIKELKSLKSNNRTIKAVMRYKMVTNASLKESKDYIDRL